MLQISLQNHRGIIRLVGLIDFPSHSAFLGCFANTPGGQLTPGPSLYYLPPVFVLEKSCYREIGPDNQTAGKTKIERKN